MKIQVLDPEVVDRIAAGEVLDRPANLVKELVENSLDAGADQIDIEFAGGGREVLISDNGDGIAHGEMLLALQRHATSKIRASEDLFRLVSFGFRGEALSSIAAVSRVTMTSRARGSDQGYRLKSEFGIPGESQPVSARPGCELRVSELFGNVPARLKFLKSEAAEHGQIKATLKALALAHPEAGFHVRCKDHLLFHWPKTDDWSERARLVLEMDGLYRGAGEVNGVRADVLVSSPLETAQVNRNMWFFVQGRWIQDRSLTAAVMEAYRNLLMHGEYPSVAVRLELPPEEVDVNVHPAKSQVKFRDPQSVFRAVSRTIRAVLEKAPWLSEGETAPAFTLQPTAPAEEQTNMGFSGRAFERTQYAKKSFQLNEVRTALASIPDPASASAPAPAPNVNLNSNQFQWSNLQVIGQLNHTYIVSQSADSFYLVDQHAAHERVVFERLQDSYRHGKVESQALLLPLVLDFSAAEVEVLIQQREALEKMGLSVERMGPESLAVQAIPSLINESGVSEALRKLAADLSSDLGSSALEAATGEVFASMACHSVIRAGQSMSPEEMKSLLQQMDQYPLSSFCPHGRPVFVRRRFSELEREFGRIV